MPDTGVHVHVAIVVAIAAVAAAADVAVAIVVSPLSDRLHWKLLKRNETKSESKLRINHRKLKARLGTCSGDLRLPLEMESIKNQQIACYISTMQSHRPQLFFFE